MTASLKLIASAVLALAVIGGLTAGHLAAKRPQRSGSIAVASLVAPVTVRYDDIGVPHIEAQNEADMYRALGYVHAQDRLFQMEMARRLSRGELAEVFGPRLVDTDRLFRVLRLRDWADAAAARMSASTGNPAQNALIAYLEGVNAFVRNGPAPLEFELLGIPRRAFTLADTLSVSAYLAYSFASAFKTEPALTYIRDQLGPDYLADFDLAWHPAGVTAESPTAPRSPYSMATAMPWAGLAQLAQLSNDAISRAGFAQLEGSNAWVIAGSRTQSGEPILAGDPHIAFSAPAVWYEAHLKAPGFELYGHHANLVPVALLGLNQKFAWSLTMFQNDDIDLVREKINPDNPDQAWSGDARSGRWVDIETRSTTISVKGAAAVELTLRQGPHGPIINDAFPVLGATQGTAAQQPIALWWTLYASDTGLLDAMYGMNRADTLDKARAAAAKIDAPGLNVLWANAAGDIAWWAAARLPKRPAGVDPAFILDAASGQAEKPGWHDFRDNPQQENPARGHIASANHQPAGPFAVPGYYALPDRAIRLEQALADPAKKWRMSDAQALQTDDGNGYGPRILARVLPILRPQLSDPDELKLLDLLAAWDGRHPTDAVAPTLFNQLLYEIPRVAMADEMARPEGPDLFAALLRVRGLDQAIPRLLAHPESVWWDDVRTAKKETREDGVIAAWRATLAHLTTQFGKDPARWTWGRAHTVTHGHPLGKLPPLNLVFDAGPYPAPGGHETPNNYSNPIGPLPLAVTFGPSTRRVIDFATPDASMGSNPVGQSGVVGDPHYADQAAMHMAGGYRPHRLADADIAAHTRGKLQLVPAR